LAIRFDEREGYCVCLDQAVVKVQILPIDLLALTILDRGGINTHLDLIVAWDRISVIYQTELLLSSNVRRKTSFRHRPHMLFVKASLSQICKTTLMSYSVKMTKQYRAA